VSELTTSLKSLLADAVSVYLQAHGYHWNVEGADFSQYHALFEMIYTDIYESIDPIAENLRKLDEYAPFMLSKLEELSSITIKAVKPEPKEMAKELLKSNEAILKSLNDVFKKANSENQQGVANFIAERIDMHQKWIWQLRASTK
jgi:starvation-inducible DNA-binding protein